MILVIENVIPAPLLPRVRELLARAPFVDGKLSAGSAAMRVKANEEVARGAPELEELNGVVMTHLVRHPTYRGGAFPLHVATPFYARYAPGATYGDHVDDPIMGADGVVYRSDIAITVFLNEPADYDGGELVIRTSFGDQTVKLAAGSAVMYPASSLHHVAPVRRGERLVAVTWVQSAIRDPARRELLHELNLAREKLLRDAPDGRETALVNRAFDNLVRMWSEI
jgi:PKHD-type hydroxylase